MTSNPVRDIVNLLIYGGAFIGLCASCMTALTFDLLGDITAYGSYIGMVGIATAALYSAHKVIGLQKVAHIKKNERYAVIRRYKAHIWLYCIGWIAIGIWWFANDINIRFLLWLLPGGMIALLYVLPFLSGGRRVRDLGWIKIILIGFSWAWLTAFIPSFYFKELPFFLASLITTERFLFIVVITIPFEIRDLKIDASVGLTTMPAKFGLRRSIWAGYIMCGLIILTSGMLSFHYFDPPYWLAWTCVSLLTIWVLNESKRTDDDYFFSGLTDGLMIMAAVLYTFFSYII